MKYNVTFEQVRRISVDVEAKDVSELAVMAYKMLSSDVLEFESGYSTYNYAAEDENGTRVIDWAE